MRNSAFCVKVECKVFYFFYNPMPISKAIPAPLNVVFAIYLCPASHLIIHVSDTVWIPMQTLVPDVCFVNHKSLQNSISLMILIKAHLLPTLPNEAFGATADATGHN